MSLTLERLDLLDWTNIQPSTHAELIDYARERAAREKCEALRPGGWPLVLQMDYPDVWLARVLRPDRTPSSYGFGSTPLDAYLALAAALKEAAR